MSDKKDIIITVNETVVIMAFITTVLGSYKDANTTMILTPTIIMLAIFYDKIKIKAIKYLSWVTMAIAFGTVIYRQFSS
tara:strand:- start:519 stop:755 length:237 start_codon:yes stop_codon:yes gene_type:complete